MGERERAAELAVKAVAASEEVVTDDASKTSAKAAADPSAAVDGLPAASLAMLSTENNAPLADGWTEHKDKNSGRPYYYNQSSCQSTWVKPVVTPSDSNKTKEEKVVKLVVTKSTPEPNTLTTKT